MTGGGDQIKRNAVASKGRNNLKVISLKSGRVGQKRGSATTRILSRCGRLRKKKKRIGRYKGAAGEVGKKRDGTQTVRRALKNRCRGTAQKGSNDS